MRDHKLVPVKAPFRDRVLVARDSSESAASPRLGVESSTCPTTCPVHSGEPLQFFCLSCVECICAECVIHLGSAHHNHEVVNVRVAFQQLSQPIKQTLETAAARLQASPKRSRSELLPLEDAFSKMKLDVVNSFESLFSSLKNKEEELVGGADDCGRLLDATMLAKAQDYEAQLAELGRLQAMLDALADGQTVMDEVQRLNLYVAVKDGLASLPLGVLAQRERQGRGSSCHSGSRGVGRRSNSTLLTSHRDWDNSDNSSSGAVAW